MPAPEAVAEGEEDDVGRAARGADRRLPDRGEEVVVVHHHGDAQRRREAAPRHPRHRGRAGPGTSERGRRRDPRSPRSPLRPRGRGRVRPPPRAARTRPARSSRSRSASRGSRAGRRDPATDGADEVREDGAEHRSARIDPHDEGAIRVRARTSCAGRPGPSPAAGTLPHEARPQERRERPAHRRRRQPTQLREIGSARACRARAGGPRWRIAGPVREFPFIVQETLPPRPARASRHRIRRHAGGGGMSGGRRSTTRGSGRGCATSTATSRPRSGGSPSSSSRTSRSRATSRSPTSPARRASRSGRSPSSAAGWASRATRTSASSLARDAVVLEAERGRPAARDPATAAGDPRRDRPRLRVQPGRAHRDGHPARPGDAGAGRRAPRRRPGGSSAWAWGRRVSSPPRRRSKLRKLGLDAVSLADTHQQAMSAALLDERDVLLAISHSGRTIDTIARPRRSPGRAGRTSS